MLGLRLGHRRRHALGGQAVPDRRQFRKRLAVAIELDARGRRRHSAARWRRETAIEIVEAAVLGVDHDDRVDQRQIAGGIIARMGLGPDRFRRPSPGRRADERLDPQSTDRRFRPHAIAPAFTRLLISFYSVLRHSHDDRRRHAAGSRCRKLSHRLALRHNDKALGVGIRDCPAGSGSVGLRRTIRRGDAAGHVTRAEVRRQAERLGALGRSLFFDPSLSGSGKLACSSCHDPAHAFGPPNALAGATRRRRPAPAGRRGPSRRLKYLQAVPPFTEHFFESEDEADESIDNGPTGGLTWDGRVDRGADQARIPLLSDFEMGNRGRGRGGAPAARGGLWQGDRGNCRARRQLPIRRPSTRRPSRRSRSIEQDYRTFYPYSSKYDAVLAGKAELTSQEARGLELFEAPNKGNCASCHVSQRGNDGTPPQFTDYGLIALAVPRNRDIPANKDPAYFDLGLCGPLRTDFLKREDYCGLFRTPTLRNVALRQTFFHNGVFHSLREAVRFYVETGNRSRTLVSTQGRR